MWFYFLDVAVERETDGDLMLGDMGQGMPFRAGAFDGAISVSALQWLCYADKASHNPAKRLSCFFSTLFASLSRTARAVLQFYPENSQQIELITTQATKAGFFGGVVVDYPNSTKAKKMFLVLMTGGVATLPKALGTASDSQSVPYTSKRFDTCIYMEFIYYSQNIINPKKIYIVYVTESILKTQEVNH